MLKENIEHVLEPQTSFWQTQWDTVREWFGNDDFNMEIWGTLIVNIVVYFGVGLVFSFVYLTGKPRFAMKYRIQKDPSHRVTMNEFLRVAALVAFNQIVVSLPFLLVYFHLMTFETRTLPTLLKTLSDLLCCFFVEEVLFFYTHRFMHKPFMFKYHKIHHRWTSPFAITAAYCHPVEHIIANLFPVFMGPVVLGSHLSTLWLWVSAALIGTLSLHSGFHILPQHLTEFHDYHHMRKHLNFGIFGLMDRLYGTNGFHQKDKAH